LALAAQAMRRMDRLEAGHRIQFQRIMEAPHAAIAYEMFEHLLALGYEATLATPELLVRHNPHIQWPATLGADRTEMLGGGLPVIPRIRISPEWRNEVLLAAFLRKPIVLVGHHIDAVNDLELLAEFASVVNSLDGVTWASVQEIARSNYKTLRREDALNIKAYSRRFYVTPAEGVEALFIHRPWLRGEADEMLIVKSGDREIFRGVGSGVIGPIPVSAQGMLEIFSPPANAIDYRTVEAPKASYWPMVRKVLTEMRDRTAPLRDRAARIVNAPRAKSPATKTAA
jgi:hypothetical protein